MRHFGQALLLTALCLRPAAADGAVAATARPALCGEDSPEHSGRLPAGKDSYFYYFVESRSATRLTDPLVLWMTGGPGCSSMLAALDENGPCKVIGRRGHLWEMARRQFSWVDAANVVWVDQPGGVGFSDRPGLPGLTHDEHQVGENMFGFMQSFLEEFPRYASVPFFVFGESYAGHYVPAVAARILREQQAGFGIRLEGAGIGNGLVSPRAQFESMPVMAINGGGAAGSLHKGFINISEYGKMESALPKCEALMQKCQRELGTQQTTCLSAYMFCTITEVQPVSYSNLNPYDLRKTCLKPPMCYNETLTTEFLNDPKVQESLGFQQFRPWQPCNMTVNIQFVASGDFFRDSRPQVVELLAAGVGVLVYNGDDDYMVDWVGSKLWMEQLRWPHHEEWASALDEALMMDGQDRGRVRSVAGLTFVQVYNAGHLVPMDQPSVSLEMLRRFISHGSAWRPQRSAGAVLLSQARVGFGSVLAGIALFAISAAIAFALLTADSLRLRHPQEHRKEYLLMA